MSDRPTLAGLAEMVRQSAAVSGQNGAVLSTLVTDVALVKQQVGQVISAINEPGRDNFITRVRLLETTITDMRAQAAKLDERKWQAWLAIMLALLNLVLSWFGSHSVVTVDPGNAPVELHEPPNH